MKDVNSETRLTTKPKVLSVDIETYSSAELSKCGVYRYVEAPDFEILLFAYAFDDEDIEIIDLACGEQLPQQVIDALEDESVIKAAWNAQFERTCLSKYLGHQLSPDSWQCSMVHAASLSLPLSLKEAAKVLKTGEQKDRAGENLIKYFSIPCKPIKANGGRTRNLPEHDMAAWQRFKDYCVQDVRTERDIRKRLARFPMLDIEWDYYHMDQRINDRGVRIDTTLVTQAITCDLLLSEEMTKRAYELTGLENPNSVSQLKQWLQGKGIPMESLGKKEVAAMIRELDTNGCDQEAMDMLKLRLQMAKSSVKKYQAAERCVCADGRARGLFQFYGASRTGRWSGRNIQLQNLPQNHINTLDEARMLVKTGCFEGIELLYGNTPDKVCVLEEGMQYKAISLPPEDSQFLSTRQFGVEEICRMFRVPPHMVQDLQHATFSNIEHQSIDFVVHTLTPWLVRIEQAIIKDLLLEEEKDEYFPKFNVDGLLRGDYQSRMTGYATGISNGFLSPNDIHRLENMDLIPAEDGGDDYYLNGGYVKLKDAGKLVNKIDTTDNKEGAE